MRNRTVLLSITVISILIASCNPLNLLRTSAPTPQASPAAGSTAPTTQPTRISGTFTFTNDFVLRTYYLENAVALADLTGFILRDKEWKTPTESQTLGFMQVDPIENKGSFYLLLPAKPEGTQNDVDSDAAAEVGIQVFTVAYWPNLIDGPFSEGDDPSYGWPNYLASIKTDAENKDEIIGGKLVVWSPDEDQAFPTSFGPDNLLFTADDPMMPLPQGYSVVDLDQDPFMISRNTEEIFTLYEPTDVALKDFSNLGYLAAFEKMFNVVRSEYAFNGIAEKQSDYDSLWQELEPRIREAEQNNDPRSYFLALRDFAFAFRDGHVGLSGGQIEEELFTAVVSSGYGFSIRVLDDSSVLVNYVSPGTPASTQGIQPGDIVLELNGKPILEAIDEVLPLSGPFSTDFSRQYQQARYLLRAPIGTEAVVKLVTPGSEPREVTITAVEDDESFTASSIFTGYDPTALPVEYKILDSGLGYIRINSNYDDLGLIVRVFQRALNIFQQYQLPGIIIDLRMNPGGANLGLAGFLYDQEIPLGQLEYFSDQTGQFEPEGPREKVLPNQEQYQFEKMALLVGQDCTSACELEAYGFSQIPGMQVFGETPSAGVEAEVARGQFVLPEGFSLQIPTGRFTLPDGSIFLEGQGVPLTEKVPVNAQTVLSGQDNVLRYAELALLTGVGTAEVASQPPLLLKVKDPVVILDQGYPFLEDLAIERYDDLMAPGTTYTYTGAASNGLAALWAFTWCTDSPKTTEANFKQFDLQFTLDGEDIPIDQFAVYDFSPSAEEHCRYLLTIVGNWPPGKHSLQTSLDVKGPIDDGYTEYEPGQRVYDYIIVVSP